MQTSTGPQVLKQIELELFEIQLRDDGILYITIRDARELMIDDIELAIFCIGKLLNGKKVPTLIKHLGFAYPSTEVRAYFAKKEANPFSIAECFIIDNLGLKLLGKFYLNFNKPERPTQLFEEESKAIAWLKTFL